MLYFRITEQPNQTTTPIVDIFDDATSANPLEFDCRGKPDGRYKHPSDCYSYVKCSYEVAKVVRCPDELIFDDLTKSCSS